LIAIDCLPPQVGSAVASEAPFSSEQCEQITRERRLVHLGAVLCEEIREAAADGAHDGAPDGASAGGEGSIHSRRREKLRHVGATSAQLGANRAQLGATGEERQRPPGLRPKHVILGYDGEAEPTGAQLGANSAHSGAKSAQYGAGDAQFGAISAQHGAANEDDEELVAIHLAAMAAEAEAEASMAMHEVQAAKAEADADTAANDDLALQIDDLALQIPFRLTREAQRQAIQAEALRPRLARHGAPHAPPSAEDVAAPGADGGADGSASAASLTTAPEALACHTAPGRPTRRSHLASTSAPLITTRLDATSSASQPELLLQRRRSTRDLPGEHPPSKRPLTGAPRTSASLSAASRPPASLSSPQTSLPGSLAKGSSYVDYYKRCHVAVAVGAARRFTQEQLQPQGAAEGATNGPTAALVASASAAALAASYGSAASEQLCTAAGMPGGAPGAVAGTWSKGGDGCGVSKGGNGCGVGAAAVAAGTALPAAGSAALCPLSARPLQRVRSAPVVKHARLPNLDAGPDIQISLPPPPPTVAAGPTLPSHGAQHGARTLAAAAAGAAAGAARVRPRTAGTARPAMDTAPVRPKLVPGTARSSLAPPASAVVGTPRAAEWGHAVGAGEPPGTALAATPGGAQLGARPSTAPVHRLSEPNQEAIRLRWARLPPPSDAELAAVAAAATAAAVAAAYAAAGISVDDEDDEGDDDDDEGGEEGEEEGEEVASQQALPVGAVGGTMLVGGLQVPTTARASGGFRLAAPPSSQALAPHRVMPSAPNSAPPIRRGALAAFGSGRGFGATLAKVAAQSKAKLEAAARQAPISQVTQAAAAAAAAAVNSSPTGTPLWPPAAHPPAAHPPAAAPSARAPATCCAHDGASFEDNLNAAPTQIRQEQPFGWASALAASHAATQKVIKVSVAAASELCGPHAHRPKSGISEHRAAAAAAAAAAATAGATASASSMHRPKLGLHGSGGGLVLEGGGRGPKLGLAGSKHASVAELAAIGARGVPFPPGLTEWVHAPAARDSARADLPAPTLWGAGQVGVTVASHPFAHWMLDPQAPARSAPETTALLQPVVHGEHVAEDFEQLWGVQRPTWVSMTLSNG